jgi:hypothetical protein
VSNFTQCKYNAFGFRNKMFSGFDEASRDMTYFVWILPGGEPPNTMTLSLSSLHIFGYAKKNP